MSYTPVAANPALRSAVFAAIRWHETRDLEAAIYGISFAEDGQSGGSFGAMQNDCHASPGALAVFTEIMAPAAMSEDQRRRVIGAVSRHQAANPLDALDRAAVNQALSSAQGRDRVDALDREVFAGLLPMLDACQAAADRNGGATIGHDALIGMAIWINASGPPSVLLRWLQGLPVTEHAGTPAQVVAGQVVTENALIDYLRFTLEMSRRPSLLHDLVNAVTIGLAALADASPATH